MCLNASPEMTAVLRKQLESRKRMLDKSTAHTWPLLRVHKHVKPVVVYQGDLFRGMEVKEFVDHIGNDDSMITLISDIYEEHVWPESGVYSVSRADIEASTKTFNGKTSYNQGLHAYINCVQSDYYQFTEDMLLNQARLPLAFNVDYPDQFVACGSFINTHEHYIRSDVNFPAVFTHLRLTDACIEDYLARLAHGLREATGELFASYALMNAYKRGAEHLRNNATKFTDIETTHTDWTGVYDG